MKRMHIGIVTLFCCMFMAVFCFADYDSSVIKEVQQALNDAGFDCGTADGIAGKATAGAIMEYQKANGLTEDGEISDELLKSLGIGTSDAEEDNRASAEQQAKEAGGITLPEYQPVPDAVSLIELMDPIMEYVDPSADGTDGIDGPVCVNMYYGTKIMRWYHLYLDAGDQDNLAAVANAVLTQAAHSIIVEALDEEHRKQYPEMREKFAAALSAAKLALDDSAVPYLEDMGISEVTWFDAEVDLMEKAVLLHGFDPVLNSETLMGN